MIYNIRITNPAPALSQRRVVFEAATYQEAVAVAHEAYRRAQRPVSLGSGAWGLENWHYVAYGVAVDRNTNSGVPARQEI